MPEVRILVVDDYGDSLETVCSALEHAGYGVIQADGPAAIAEARQHQPSAVVLDIHMSGVDGIETARQLKRTPETRHIPVIAFAARSRIEDPDPFDHICVTPCDPDVLVDMVRSVLALSVSASAPIVDVRSRAVALRERALTLCRAFTRTAMRDRLADVVAALGERIEWLDALPGAKAASVPDDYLAAPEARIAELESVLQSRGPDAELQ